MSTPKPRGVELFAQILIVRFLTVMIALGTAAYCAALYYTDLAGIDRAGQVMETRPNAEGSFAAVWSEHEDECWTDGHAKGPATAVIVQRTPTSPVVYTAKPRLVERAVDQAANGADRGLDRVFAFCVT